MSQKQHDKTILIFACLLFVGAAIFGGLLGHVLTVSSFAKAFEHTDIQICTGEQINYSAAVQELNRCKAQKIPSNFVNISPIS